jgi:hypothetical protein
LGGSVLWRDLFTKDILCLFVSPQYQEDRLTKLLVGRPLGKFDLGDEHGFNPMATFHDARGNPEPPPTTGFLRQVDEWAGGLSDLLQLRVDACQEFF